MTTSSSSTYADLWKQAFQTWIEGWTAVTGGTRPGAEGASADPFPLWRRAVDQWLGGWTAYLEGTLQTPAAAAAGGRVLDAMLNVEKPLRERTAAAMEYWLEFFNLPSRGDLIRVAAQINDANARLDELQDQVETLTDRVAAPAAGTEWATADATG
jgi:hypothetical protein